MEQHEVREQAPEATIDMTEILKAVSTATAMLSGMPIVDMPMTDAPVATPKTTAKPVATPKVTFRKFAELTDDDVNPWGVTNDRNQLITIGYLSRYIQCWCRKADGFELNRKVNFAYFLTDEWMSQWVGKKMNASQIGQQASLSPRWGTGTHKGRPSGKGKTFVSPQQAIASVVDAQQGIEPAAEGVEAPAASEPVIETVAEILADAPRVEMRVNGETITIIDLPMGKPKRKSKKQQAEAEEAELIMNKPEAIEALAESLE